jgi:CDGSH-type Zn-finger protein
MADSDVSITVAPNGPYIVSGPVPLSVEAIGVNDAGESWEYVPGRSFETKATYALCRCGASSK